MGEQVGARSKRKQQAVSLMRIKQALESESCRKQDGARYEPSSPVLTRISREELIRYAGFTVIRDFK